MPSDSIRSNEHDGSMRLIQPGDLLIPGLVPGGTDTSAVADGTDTSDDASVPGTMPRCQQCEDAGYYKKAVPFGHPDFGVLFPCTCKLEQQAERLRHELLQLSNLADFADKTFVSFSRFVPKVELAYSSAVTFARHPQGWLVLFGTYGCGKTHLAAAVANALLERKIAIYFAVVPDLLDHLRVAFKPDATLDYDELFDQIKNVAVLFLDDLGTENATPWAREKLFQLLNHRYNTKLPTMITSNRSPEDLDPRIYSRLCDPDLGEPIWIEAGDYRRRKQANKDRTDR